MPDFAAFASMIGTQFTNLDLLVEALTHRSYLNENREHAGGHNERLEFLGDAVLELAVTRFLFDKYPQKPEGELTAYRAALVNTVSLAESARGSSHRHTNKKPPRSMRQSARFVVLTNP